MAEGNGNEAQSALEHLKVRVNEHDKSSAGLRSIVEDLSHAMVVQAHLERKQSDSIADGDERQRRLDERVDKLVASIGELISRIPPDSLRAR